MKKGLAFIERLLVGLIIAFASVVMIATMVSVTTVDRDDRNLFGFKAFIVLSDSMKATDFEAGDVVVAKNVNPDTLEPGDIISFASQNADNYGETVTHKIRRKVVDASGDIGFVTYGTTTDTDDATIVTYPYIHGKYLFRIPRLGLFFEFLNTVPGYICCILLPLLFLVFLQASDTVRLFKKYRREQVDEINRQREQVETEKDQYEELRTEITRLKAQIAEIAEMNSAPAPQAPPAAAISPWDDPDAGTTEETAVELF